MESRRKHDKNMYHKKRLINHVKWLKNNKTKGHGITKLKWGYSRLKIIRCLVKQTWIRHRNFTHININTPPSWISRFVCLLLISAHVWLASFWSAHKTNHPTQQEQNTQKFRRKRRQIYFFIYTKCLSCFTKRFWDCSFFFIFCTANDNYLRLLSQMIFIPINVAQHVFTHFWHSTYKLMLSE